jgi:hypothetical protein
LRRCAHEPAGRLILDATVMAIVAGAHVAIDAELKVTRCTAYAFLAHKPK